MATAVVVTSSSRALRPNWKTAKAQMGSRAQTTPCMICGTVRARFRCGEVRISMGRDMAWLVGWDRVRI